MHDEIDKLEAGRETDALVAEKVMGWRKVSSQIITETMRGSLPWTRWWGEKQNAAGRWRIVDLPKYSASISAAWEVVEKLKAEGMTVDIQSRTPGWTVVVDELHDLGVEVRAPTAPLAICFAALKAVTGEPT